MTSGLLVRPPTPADLERLYFELARRGAPSVGRQSPWPYPTPQTTEELLVLACEMLRHDARLLSILLQWTLAVWRTLDLQRLRALMRRMQWPQAMLVLWAFAREAAPHDRELAYVVDYLSAGQERVSPPQRFFFDVEQPDSRRAQRRVGRSLRPYSRWGFLGTERPTADAFTKRVVGRYDDVTRRRIAIELVRDRGEISLREYLEAVDHTISRVQALSDLHGAGLRPTGRGRGAKWRLPRSRDQAPSR